MSIGIGSALGAYEINTMTEDAISPPIAVILNWRPPVPK